MMSHNSQFGKPLSLTQESGSLSSIPRAHISGMIPEDYPDIYLMRAANPNRELCGYTRNFKQSP